MAKGKMALGKFRGKMGGMVLRVDPSVGQIMSEYNPHPANPRTVAQTKQRGKMNLAGQVSKNLPKFALVGLDSRARVARSMFVSNLLKNITVPSTITPGSAVNYTLGFDKLVFSEGARVGLPVSVTGMSSSTGMSYKVAINDANGSANLLGGVAVVIYSVEEGSVYVNTKTMTKNGNNIEATFDIDLGPSGFGYAYVCPIVGADADLVTTYGQLQATSVQGNDNLIASILVSLMQSGAYRHSEISERISA